MLHKILSIGLLIILCSSCMKIQKKGEEQTNQNVSQMNQELNQTSSLDFNYDFTNSVQKVVFHFPHSWGNSLVVEKFLKEKSLFQREITLNEQSWSDFLVEEQAVKYKFFSKENEKITEEFEVLPALNLVISDSYDLIEKFKLSTKIKKIYFKNLELKSQAKLLLGDFKGEIIIENIQSAAGVFQTFLENSRANFEKNGRSVGDFKLTILQGSGNLKINLFAESGGDGLAGLAPDEKLTGKKGVEGHIAKFTLVPPQPCFGGRDSLCLPTNIYDCSSNPEDGGEGGAGLKGYPGSHAKNGGNVEKINLINQATQLNVSVTSQYGRKGKGGLGGSGGRGGEGGLGGDGAQRDLFRFLKLDPDDSDSQYKLGFNQLGKPCTKASKGSVGIRGEKGDDGHDGIDGIIF